MPTTVAKRDIEGDPTATAAKAETIEIPGIG